MNAKTRDALIKLTEQIQALAAGVVLTTGVQTVSEVAQACYALEEALLSDETIIETR